MCVRGHSSYVCSILYTCMIPLWWGTWSTTRGRGIALLRTDRNPETVEGTSLLIKLRCTVQRVEFSRTLRHSGCDLLSTFIQVSVAIHWRLILELCLFQFVSDCKTQLASLGSQIYRNITEIIRSSFYLQISTKIFFLEKIYFIKIWIYFTVSYLILKFNQILPKPFSIILSFAT